MDYGLNLSNSNWPENLNESLHGHSCREIFCHYPCSTLQATQTQECSQNRRNQAAGPIYDRLALPVVKIGRWPSVAFNKKNNQLLPAKVYDDHGRIVALIEDNK
jgi:hypothetical protein